MDWSLEPPVHVTRIKSGNRGQVIAIKAVAKLIAIEEYWRLCDSPTS